MPRRYLLGVLVTFASACAASSVGSSSRSLGSVTPRSQSQLADPSADDVSPRLSTCLGRTTHCVMPDFDLGAVSYDFGAKITLITKKDLTLSVNYDLELKEDFYSHNGYVNVRYDF